MVEGARASTLAPPSPRVRGEGWGEGAVPLPENHLCRSTSSPLIYLDRSDSLRRPLTLAPLDLSPHAGRGEHATSFSLRISFSSSPPGLTRWSMLQTPKKDSDGESQKRQRRMDCRVKPGNDDAEDRSRDAGASESLARHGQKRRLPANESEGGGAPTGA
jgi:hypothetical protein